MSETKRGIPRPVGSTALRGPKAATTATYHVFLASPGDVDEERRKVREFFREYNVSYAEPRGFRFEIVDWENYSSAGIGRPQELITAQTLEKYKDSLALVIGIMAQRFGSPSGTHESGTQEEFEWALKKFRETEFPAVKWFFKDIKKFEVSVDLDAAQAALEQWSKVRVFRERVDREKKVFCRTYGRIEDFDALLRGDLSRWLNQRERPWFTDEVSPPPAQDGAEDWPAYALNSLSLRLNEAFVEHMKTRDDLTEAQARKRYIQTVLKLRRVSTGILLEPRAGETSISSDRLPDEGTLDDYTHREGVRLLAVGPGGLGKTTTLRHLAAEGARRAVNDATAPVHIYLRLTTFDAKEDGFEALLDRLSEAASLDRESFEENWRRGPRAVVFLLDAFNEVARTHREACTKALMTLLQSSHPAHRYVITTRPGSELEQIAGQTTENLGLKVLDLLEFGPEKVDAYLKAQNLEKLAPKLSTPLRALASNPFLLWAITRVFAGSPRSSTPTNRGTLFKALIDEYIFEHREKSKPKPRPTGYNYQLIKKPVLARVALDLIKDGGTQIRLNDSLRAKFGKILLELANDNKKTRMYPFKEEVFMPGEFNATTLFDEMQDNGIIVREGEALRFMHESVQEYFAAVALQDVPQKDLLELVPAVNVAVPYARGPIFEALVTLAGLTDAEKLVQLASHVQERHPLLAGHMYVEAGLLDRMAILARDTFVPMSKRAHEGYRRLGVMGLALSDLGDPSIADQLLREVQDLSSPGRADAESAILAHPTDYVVESLIKISLAAPEQRYGTTSLLARISEADPRRILEALARVPDGEPDQIQSVAKLFASIVNKIYDQKKQEMLRQNLIALCAERDVSGDIKHAKVMEQMISEVHFVKPRVLFGVNFPLASEIRQLLQQKEKERQQFLHTCSRAEDSELDRMIEAEESWKLETIYEEMRKRLFPLQLLIRAAVTKAVQAQNKYWLTRLTDMPLDQIATISDEIYPLDGEEREQAKIILDLLGDRPSTETLEHVFNNAGQEMRAFAARAAARTEGGVRLLIKQLDREVSEEVIEASLRALGRSNMPDAVAFLQDMLLDPRTASGRGELDKVVQEALVDAGAVEPTLARLTQAITSPAMGPHIVHAAGRWIDETAALDLLHRIGEFEGSPNRNIALWYLAQSRNAKAWSQLLRAGVETGSTSLAEDAASHVVADDLDTDKDLALAAAARDVLRSSLADPDPDKRIRALNLTRHMPQHWIDAAWQAEALALAKRMVGSDDPEERQAAVRPFLTFAENADELIKDLMLLDPAESVREEAAQAFGEERAKEVIAGRLKDAIRDGDLKLASRAALALKSGAFKFSVFHTSDYPFIISLQSGTVEQAVATLFALSQVYSDYDAERQSEEWAAIRSTTAAAFNRHGLESLWQAYVNGLGEMSEDPKIPLFTVAVVLQSLRHSAANLRPLVANAASIWPNDLDLVGLKVDLDIQSGDEATAFDALERLRTDFEDRINPRWLAERYLQLSRYDDAARHFREVVSKNTDDPDSWALLGWCLFLIKELAASADASRKALELSPAQPMISFNLGLTLLAGGQIQEAERTYRRACALARRQSIEDAIRIFEDAIGDFPLLPELTGVTAETRDRMKAMLEAELAQLQACTSEAAGNP